MSAEKVAKRYANALLDLTRGDAALQDKVNQDLAEIKKLYGDKEIHKVIASPVVSQELLRQVFDNVTTQLNSPKIFKDFARVLVENHRAAVVPELSKSFHKLLLAERGIVEASVVTAVALNAEEEQALKQKLEAMLHKKVELSVSIDKAILGGFVVHIDNTQLDMSLRTKLDNMTKFAVS